MQLSYLLYYKIFSSLVRGAQRALLWRARKDLIIYMVDKIIGAVLYNDTYNFYVDQTIHTLQSFVT